MNTASTLFKILIAALTISMLTACPDNKKRDRSRNVNRYDRTQDWQRGYSDPFQQPQGGIGSEWGAIAVRSTGELRNFMGGADLGYVSGSPYDDTGVRFTGSISSQIYILVWDEYAYQEGAYFWPMTVAGRPEVTSNYARVIFEDEVGQVKFEGQISGGIWTGTVQYSNSYSDGAQGTLGEFAISAAAILR